MPELPEVETVVRELRLHLPGRDVLSASLTAPDLYRRGSANVETLAGARVEGVARRGKAILIGLRPRGTRTEDRLVIHLGMTGRLEWSASERVASAGDLGTRAKRDWSEVADDRIRERTPKKHLHARWRFSDGSELRYYDPRRFGFIFVGTTASVDESLRIGPDPFELDAAALARALSGRRAPVKALLLDQHLVSGLGNIYVDEALHLARIHPLVTGERASKHAKVILSAARRILTRAIKSRGTTFRDYRRTDGASGEFQLKLSVYGRDGEKCRVCGTAIRRIEVAQRGTHYCPRCQPRPRVSPARGKTSRAGRSRPAALRRAGYTRSP
jgi:formamidopyrimidine-DNA glycosylase